MSSRKVKLLTTDGLKVAEDSAMYLHNMKKLLWDE